MIFHISLNFVKKSLIVVCLSLIVKYFKISEFFYLNLLTLTYTCFIKIWKGFFWSFFWGYGQLGMNLITLRGRWKQKSRVLQRKWKLYLLFAVSLQLQPAKLNHIMNVKGLLNRNAIVIFLVFGIVLIQELVCLLKVL